jgi:hypothetical protein
VYSFSETRGEGGEQQASDRAELIAESAPLVRTDLLPSGTLKLTLLSGALFGEVLLAASAVVLALTTPTAVNLVTRIALSIESGDPARLLMIPNHPFFETALVLVILSRFGALFREIGMRFLAEVVFQSYMTAISISSSTLYGRTEASVGQGDGMHLFDTGRTSTLRIRIQCAFLHTVTMISTGSGGDSLSQQRYMIGAEREDRLMSALADQGYRYIKQRTDAATTRVRSQSVEMKDASQLLVDPDSGAQMIQARQQSALPGNNRDRLFLTERRGRSVDDEEG